MTLPRHEGNEQVLAQCHFTQVSRGAIGQDLTGNDPVTLVDNDALVVAGALVGSMELLQAVGRIRAVIMGNFDVVSRDFRHHTIFGRGDHITGVVSGVELHAGTDQRGLGPQQGHGLALHVRTHQRAVGVIVLKERDHGRGDRPQLTWRHIHVVDLIGRHVVDVATFTTHQNTVLSECAIVGQRRIGLGDHVQVFFICGEVVDGVGDFSGDDLAVGGLHETERVHAPVGRQRTDQTDIGSFGSLDRAHAAVVRRVHVSDFESGPLAGQTTGAERGQATLVGQARERVGLIHELRQLRGSEELLDRCHHRTDVDQRLRGDRFNILGGHAFTNNALHAGQTGADLVLDQLPHRAQTPISEVIDVIGFDVDLTARSGVGRFPRVQQHQVLDRGGDVFARDRVLVQRLVKTELLVDLVATNLCQVIALGIEVEVLKQVAGVVHGGRLARTQLAVQI